MAAAIIAGTHSMETVRLGFFRDIIARLLLPGKENENDGCGKATHYRGTAIPGGAPRPNS
jgi:hypothetical protein